MTRSSKSKGILIIEGYVYSNLHIALTAAFFLLGGYELFNLTIEWPMVIMISTSTLSAYALHRMIGSRIYGVDNRMPRFRFLQKNRFFFYALLGLAATLSLVSLFYVNTRQIYCLLPMAIITGLYVIPVKGVRWFREFSYVKIFLLSGVWAYVFVLPALSSGTINVSDDVSLVAVFTEKFFFILALCIPFDIRDKDHDHRSGLKTLATFLSLDGIMRLIHLFTLVCICLVGILYAYNIYDDLTCALLILFYLVLNRAVIGSRGKEDLYFQGLLDGLILIQGLIHLI